MKKTALAALMCLSATGCAFMDYDNLGVLAEFDESTEFIDTPLERIALTPVTLPVATAAFAADVFVVYPIKCIPGALDRTRDLLWDLDIKSYYIRMLTFIPALIASPLYFTFDWLGHCIWDIEDARP